jgi:hypothetical protein
MKRWILVYIIMVIFIIVGNCTATDINEKEYMIGHHVSFLEPFGFGNNNTIDTNSLYGGMYLWTGDVVDCWYEYLLIQWEDGTRHWVNSVYVYDPMQKETVYPG